MTTDSYQLLKDINSTVQRLEDKMDNRMNCMETRVNELEKFRDVWSGKIAMISAFVGVVGALFIGWVKERLKI
jgi:hypothetical protein